ncbi:hypothetical protein LSAT2_012482 [Lamellibrachia satsuma]|nr:hypothetical protein LSAT2_012482 [Lamellibrachia satsuma]
MSGGKGKRVSSSPLASSSDEEGTAEKDGPANDSVSDSREQDKTLLAVDTSGPSPTLPDHDYEAAHSPGDSSSSTTSEPSYIRQPGFTHHAHRVVCYPKAKKKRIFIATVKGQKHREPIPPKSRPRREPLPMRMRALPQSFWQQPNVADSVPPSSTYPILPPLYSKDSGEDVTDIRPITPPEEKERNKLRVVPERMVTLANTELLLKLFDGVEGRKTNCRLKRGRPRKMTDCASRTLPSCDDPYLVDCVSQKLFPQLSLEHSDGAKSSGTTLQLLTVHEDEKFVLLPTLSVEQNYPQMLSELVMHI